VLVEEVQKAEAHLATHGEIGSTFKKVRHKLNIHGYHVENHRTVQTQLKELLEELEAKNCMGKDLLNDKEEELKSRLKDMKDQMVTEKEKEREKIDPKGLSQEGQFLQDQSALLVLGEALQHAEGSKLLLRKDGQIMAETTKGGVSINIESLLFSSNGKARKKKGRSELVQSLVGATGHNVEAKKEIEFRKFNLTIEQSKDAQEECKMQHEELEMKKLEMEIVEHRMQHDLEMKKLEMEMAQQREETAEQGEATTVT
jgi:hypothetical protein